ncbi:MAG: hypothetical protein AMXMBFR61_20290 [Fimbriimonadales bacterium]
MDSRSETRIWRRDDLVAFFDREVRLAVGAAMGLPEDALLRYLAEMLAQFALLDHLYCIRTVEGRRLTEVAEMLMEGDIRLNACSFAREREVHRHIGDFTLFWTGMYPEALPRLKSGTMDALIDYVRQGKQSYYIASTFDLGRYRDEAPLFRTLSEQFERCMEGLRLLRRRWPPFEGFGPSADA